MGNHLISLKVTNSVSRSPLVRFNYKSNLMSAILFYPRITITTKLMYMTKCTREPNLVLMSFLIVYSPLYIRKRFLLHKCTHKQAHMMQAAFFAVLLISHLAPIIVHTCDWCQFTIGSGVRHGLGIIFTGPFMNPVHARVIAASRYSHHHAREL